MHKFNDFVIIGFMQFTYLTDNVNSLINISDISIIILKMFTI